MDRRKLTRTGEFAYLDQEGKGFWDIEGALRSLGIKWTPNLSAYVSAVCAGRKWTGPIPRELTTGVYLELVRIFPELAAASSRTEKGGNGDEEKG